MTPRPPRTTRPLRCHRWIVVGASSRPEFLEPTVEARAAGSKGGGWIGGGVHRVEGALVGGERVAEVLQRRALGLEQETGRDLAEVVGDAHRGRPIGGVVAFEGLD